ncbi:MAG TPA: DDE-type integrase/transposase/recombinase [Oligoflexus sp.]|uniref:DDE-type integrase/transposase/recombinase n=1 Tax=Oligoflexus sp. TaxID=1971216 RepID=UPI002D5C73FF|nr:DDE-type integrase/transposase/recombinase [Oligoflexus sp.]HYX33725.1 DDE-type integrase/transposase/recombinase [Oligoflexus sp.]
MQTAASGLGKSLGHERCRKGFIEKSCMSWKDEQKGTIVQVSKMQKASKPSTDIEIRQNKYLNIIEQDHRPIKQLCRATLGFGRFRTARITIGGFEAMRIIRKRQLKAEGHTSAEIFHSMAA